jgi:hypothetical protein
MPAVGSVLRWLPATAPTDAVDSGPAYSFGLSLIRSLIRLRSRAFAETRRLRSSQITDGPGLRGR